MDELQKASRDRLDVGSALQQAGRHETRRMLSWVLATAIVAAVFALAARDLLKVMVVVICGVALLLWSIRLRWGIVAAARDFRQAATRPNRAFVVLLHDVNPKAFRPLLGIWAVRPIAGQQLPMPDRVYRCDDELDDLKSLAGAVVVHEAWVDTGPHSWSKPRWVAADRGIGVVHRRAFLGRLYLWMLIRRDRPDAPRALTIDPPAPRMLDGPVAAEHTLVRDVAERVVVLALVAALAWLVI